MAVMVVAGGVMVTVTVGAGGVAVVIVVAVAVVVVVTAVVATGVPAPRRRQIKEGLLPYPQGQIMESLATAGQPVMPAEAFQVQTCWPVFSLKA